MAVTQNTPSVNIGTASFGPAVAQYWVKEALQALYPSLVFTEFVAEGGPNAYLTIPARTGTKVNFHREPVIAASYTAIQESADDPSPIAFALTGVSAQVKEYGQQIVIPDLTESVALNSAIGRTARGLAFAGLRSYNGLIGGAISAGGTKYYCGTSNVSAAQVSASETLTKAELDKLVMRLHSNNVRCYPNGLYKIAVHPTMIKALRADTGTANFWELVKYINAVKEAREDFMVGTLSQFKVIETTELASTSVISGTGWGYHNVWSGYEGVGAVALGGKYTPKPGSSKNAVDILRKSRWEPSESNFSIITHLPGSAGTADPFDRRASVAYKFFTAVKVLATGSCGVLFGGSTTGPTGS